MNLGLKPHMRDIASCPVTLPKGAGREHSEESVWPSWEKGKVAGFVLSLVAPEVRRHHHSSFGVEPQGMEITRVIQPDYQTRQKFIWMPKKAALGPKPAAQSMSRPPSDLV